MDVVSRMALPTDDAHPSAHRLDLLLAGDAQWAQMELEPRMEALQTPPLVCLEGHEAYRQVALVEPPVATAPSLQWLQGWLAHSLV